MPIVSNTSPILNLAIVDQLNLLQQQFGQILIPETVLEELKIDEPRPGSEVVKAAIQTGWIQVQAITDRALFQLLKQSLDPGEAAAIALAVELSANLILLDEREGRKIAKSLGLNATGILGVLLKAKRSGSLSSVQTVINDLINKAGFRISADLLQKILQASQ
ncbi:MAG: DUF3368 domain-containing protein [Cyanobacteriota bacterium]|nr:DUF3368 domain-containing protein [Cyanobacteriota bacterium]